MPSHDISADFIDKLTKKCNANTVFRRRPVNQNGRTLAAGDIATDGSIYLGYYQDKDWFVTAQNAKDPNGNALRMDFNGAAQYAKNLKAHGHDDWRIPSGSDDLNEPDILKEMYKNSAIGAFRDSFDTVNNIYWYWSSTPSRSDYHKANERNFSSGSAIFWSKDDKISVRPVRAQSR
jgi:hypothetical protein